MTGKSSSEIALRKLQKAHDYATEPSRLEVLTLTITMKSEHGMRRVELNDGQWSCTCEYFAPNNTCSHVMTVELILRDKAGVRLKGISD
jgi:hypothetical protein